MDWLDTQTQALLQGEPPQKLAPPTTAEFGLVLLRKGMDHRRLVRAVSRINDCSDLAAASLLGQPLPLIVNPDLEYGDALLGQFELICCDAPAAFVNSEVLEQGDEMYLTSLFHRIGKSPEFAPCTLAMIDIPETEEGRKFGDQFLGVAGAALQELVFPFRIDVPFKKARIMKHWAGRIGANLECDAILE